MKIKKHINFEKLDEKAVKVESIEALLKEGVITEKDIRVFNSFDILPHQCHHTSIMAAILGDGIDSVAGRFTKTRSVSGFHCINRKKDQNGNWRYFDLTDWKIGLHYKSFYQERAFNRENAYNCFSYYRYSFNTSFPAIGNFYYDDNGDLKTTIDGATPRLFSKREIEMWD